MSLILRLHSSTLESVSSPLPVNFQKFNFYEITVHDLIKEVHWVLSKKHCAPFNQLKARYLVISIYAAKTQKLVDISSVKESMLLTELGLVPGSTIHVQDQRMITA